jgi:hypothetical protein
LWVDERVGEENVNVALAAVARVGGRDRSGATIDRENFGGGAGWDPGGVVFEAEVKILEMEDQ